MDNRLVPSLLRPLSLITRRADSAGFSPNRPFSLARHFLAAGLVLFGVTGCASTAERDELQVQLAEIQRQLLQISREAPKREEVTSLEGTVTSELGNLVRADADHQLDLQRLSDSIEQLSTKLEDVLDGFDRLGGQVEAVQEELEELRLSRPFSTPGGNEPPSPDPPSADPLELYTSSYNEFLRGNYEAAINGFRLYIEAHPRSDQADNAQYWLGECFFNQQQFRRAITEFDRVEEQYPNSERLASALLRKGYAFLELGEISEGRRALQRVVDRFAGRDEGILAQRQLDSLN